MRSYPGVAKYEMTYVHRRGLYKGWPNRYVYFKARWKGKFLGNFKTKTAAKAAIAGWRTRIRTRRGFIRP